LTKSGTQRFGVDPSSSKHGSAGTAVLEPPPILAEKKPGPKAGDATAERKQQQQWMAKTMARKMRLDSILVVVWVAE
jgi:hypothetical protein